MLGSCLVSLHFLWAILYPQAVYKILQFTELSSVGPPGKTISFPRSLLLPDENGGNVQRYSYTVSQCFVTIFTEPCDFSYIILDAEEILGALLLGPHDVGVSLGVPVELFALDARHLGGNSIGNNVALVSARKTTRVLA